MSYDGPYNGGEVLGDDRDKKNGRSWHRSVDACIGTVPSSVPSVARAHLFNYAVSGTAYPSSDSILNLKSIANLCFSVRIAIVNPHMSASTGIPTRPQISRLVIAFPYLSASCNRCSDVSCQCPAFKNTFVICAASLLR